jgi:DNA-binding MarR family transcriptional regulator
MTSERWTNTELESFREAAQSLKLYRRADLPGKGGESLIEELYVDPLPNDHVLSTMVRPNTTFIVGRKGAGKSTVFLRAQHELRRRSGFASAYVDIKTVYESSQVDPQLLTKASQLAGSLSASEIEQLLLYRHFLSAVIKEIRVELESRIRISVWAKVKQSVGGTLSELFAGLDALLGKAYDDDFINVLGVHTGQATQRDKTEQSSTKDIGGELAAASSPAVKLSAHSSASYSTTSEREREYADVLMRTFDIRQYISDLRTLLDRVSIDHLYIFVDDFSELPPEAMKIVVDSIIAPLNNWSDELVKFKIAAYPGRIYYGQIDKAKIDEINLDLYALYGTADLGVMEDKAVDFTRRLLERRFEHYGVDVARYFGSERATGHDELWRQLFYATMANPRNLGYVLYFIYEADLLYGRPISLKSIRDAASRYYEEKVEAYFNLRRFLHESFEERSSIFSLKELLDALVLRARDLRRYQGSSVIRDIEGRPPTSHFHVIANLDGLLATLELNFFVTKYFVMKDRDGRQVTVFALNYGLCQKEVIEFGRPTGKREYRLYYVERMFDATSILNQYLRTNQEITCDHCRATFEPELLPALMVYDMQCPDCKEGQCTVVNLSRKYEEMLRAVDDGALLPQIELGIIHALGTQNEPQVASDVAGELDCSYQLVGKRARMLADRGLVDRDQKTGGRRVFSITETARDIYMQAMDDPDVEL